MPEPWLFEALTTIPFGIMHNPDDPNRLITCYIDPDIGIDRALDTLNVSYMLKFWPNGTDGRQAIRYLTKSCKEEPIVIGPLNMDDLPYYFHPELYKTLDHYIVIKGMSGDRFVALDPEGFPLVLLTEETILKAWRGNRIPEGRGEFILRRMNKGCNPSITPQMIVKTLTQAISNIEKAQEEEYGGSNGLRQLASYTEKKKFMSSHKRGLTYSIPTRIQRCSVIIWFIDKAASMLNDHREIPWGNSTDLLFKQIRIYNEILSALMNNDNHALKSFERIATLEDEIRTCFNRIGDTL